MRRLVVILLVASTPALALDPLEGSRSGTTTQGYIRGQEAWSSLGDFGRCYASSERKDALKLVATRPGSVEEAQTYKELFVKSDQSCLGSITELREYDCSYSVPGVGRYRVNVFRQRQSIALSMRSIPLNIPTFDQLGRPLRYVLFRSWSEGSCWWWEPRAAASRRPWLRSSGR